MVKTYCNYGIYDEDTARCAEEGDNLDRLTYWDDGRKVTLEDVHISSITADEVTIETEDFEEIRISVDDIEDWD